MQMHYGEHTHSNNDMQTHSISQLSLSPSWKYNKTEADKLPTDV